MNRVFSRFSYSSRSLWRCVFEFKQQKVPSLTLQVMSLRFIKLSGNALRLARNPSFGFRAFYGTYSEKAALSLASLHLTAAKGTAKELAALSKEVDVSAADYDSRTALHVAAASGNLENVRWLISRGAALNPLDRWKATPLSEAMRNNQIEVAQVLKAAGGYSSTVDELTTDFISAAGAGNTDRVRALLAQGMPASSADYDNRTALHLAASEGNLAVVKLLVEADADTNAADRWGSTPIQDAVRNGHIEVAEFLKSVTKLDREAALVVSEQSRIALRQTLSTMKLEYGAAWIGPELAVSDCWHAEGNLNPLIKVRKEVLPNAPSGAIRRAFDTRQPVVVTNPTPADAGVRDGTNFSFKSAMFVPVVYNGKSVAVLGYFSNGPLLTAEDAKKAAHSADRHLQNFVVSEEKAEGNFLFGEQMVAVHRMLDQAGVFSDEVLREEINWYFNKLGLDNYYFHYTPLSELYTHLLAFITAKLHAKTTGELEKVRYVQEKEKTAFYMCPESDVAEMQARIERRYLSTDGPFSVKYFLSKGTASPTNRQRIAILMVQHGDYVNSKPKESESDIWELSTGSFLKERQTQTISRYENVLRKTNNAIGPVSLIEERPLENQTVLYTAFRNSFDPQYIGVSNLLRQFNFKVDKSYVESFSSGVRVHSFYLEGLVGDAMAPFIEAANLSWIIPASSPLLPLVEQGKLTLEEMAYAHCGLTFAYHFLTRTSEEFTLLLDSLKNDDIAKSRLNILRKKMRMETATEDRCAQTFLNNPNAIKLLFNDFKNHFTGPKQKPSFNKDLWTLISKNAGTGTDSQVLRALCNFNAAVMKTNFFKSNKSALSFRLDPSFLSTTDYPITPFGLFYLQGREFRGFHVRFSDVARGGVRLIRSRNSHNYRQNTETLFDENYNLAWTQEKKNKDIPEGGSKGTILLSLSHQHAGKQAFQKWVDALLDVLLPSKEVTDHLSQPEIIFLGPDEGTADVMDWAAVFSKQRSWPYWSALTTGKSPSLGGIPHDEYGMTTESVRAYVTGIMREVGLKETEVTKTQTGGPDGDLGSNEILVSKEKTKVVIDGSGVLYDPNGIEKEELVRLAKERGMVKNFNRSKLSRNGFLVLVDDNNVKLPDGTLVESGLTFRNTFHLSKLAAADFFVPCGGRPDSININNVNQLIVDGQPIYKYIVEGANLFISQEARLRLEEAGVVVIKDASANKGGVCSSSCEVLAALTLTDEEHQTHMRKSGGVAPEFYARYVVDTKHRIRVNADSEFNCLWRESKRLGKPMSIVSDMISNRINELNAKLKSSGMWDNPALVREVLAEVAPKSLQNLLGIETIISRLPKSYLDATLSAHFASRFVYENGLAQDEFTLYRFLKRYSSTSLE
jgi:glutamate dehydrogenase